MTVTADTVRTASARHARWTGLSRALLVILTALTMAPLMAAADESKRPRITIDDGNLDPLPVAVTDFVGETGNLERYGDQIAAVIRNNLGRSGLFDPIAEEAFIEDVENFDRRPRFGDWRILKSPLLVTGRVSERGDGRLNVEFILWDVYSEADMIGLRLTAPPDGWRRLAHLISDQIYEELTGEEGYFDTRIAFVAETGPKTRRIKRLAIMDQDGANPMYLTDGSELILTPRYNPVFQEVVYMSYAGGNPKIHLLNIESGREELVGEFPGMTFAPRFTPDGRKILMSLDRGGNSDIYIMDLRTQVTERLTHHPAIDTSPSSSPDQTRVTFNSDRSGSQQIYVMDADGRNVRRISWQEGRYATPVWSPRGDLIAFTKILRGKFYIGVMRPNGSGERLLTESFLDEAPTWSPNGRVLMFFRQTPSRADGSGGKVRLWSVDVTGYNEREISTVTDASDPAWSPLISKGMIGR